MHCFINPTMAELLKLAFRKEGGGATDPFKLQARGGKNFWDGGLSTPFVKRCGYQKAW